ncbi:EF-P 5-aminopentanol modification-associated protein YfmF [Candidatus Soleaferrea massiliensis]|uniref:EF-P 5-aminopentanol modification-associated protein YfmF n=1 Tax=Candidatus Soleaferrea massiliensis TaxID=1470354 RepID=UPI00058AC246|nr:pitrilysin family protein [Candidatus Soleaferrea massiliensis]
MIRQKLYENIYFSGITDPKFKSNRISVNLMMPLREDTVSSQAILPFLMRKGSKKLPDFTLLNQRLAELYGASLDADVKKSGSCQILNLSIQSLDDRFSIGGEAVASECAKLLCDLTLEPHFENGQFPQKDLELEKQFLIDTIEAEINEKRIYALNRCTSILCEGQPFGIGKYGTVEGAQALTAQMCTDAYRQVIKTARIEILFIGSGDSGAVMEVFRSAFADVQREDRPFEVQKPDTSVKNLKQVTEPMEVTQGKLVLGFKGQEMDSQEKQNAAQVMCALYGGTPFSRLFLNVREKLSLCYYCAARYDKVNSLMLVDSGVEIENEQKAREAILEQFEVMKRGDFTEEELQNTFLSLINALRTVEDSLGGLENWYLTQIMLGTSCSPAEQIERVSKVTRQDVIDAANHMLLDTVYFLTAKEEA